MARFQDETTQREGQAAEGSGKSCESEKLEKSGIGFGYALETIGTPTQADIDSSISDSVKDATDKAEAAMSRLNFPDCIEPCKPGFRIDIGKTQIDMNPGRVGARTPWDLYSVCKLSSSSGDSGAVVTDTVDEHGCHTYSKGGTAHASSSVVAETALPALRRTVVSEAWRKAFHECRDAFLGLPRCPFVRCSNDSSTLHLGPVETQYTTTPLPNSSQIQTDVRVSVKWVARRQCSD